jgi:hypothetical protein
MDTFIQEKRMDEMFEDGERTEHKGIAPARERIKNFKVRSIMKRNLPSAYAGTSSKMTMRTSSVKDLHNAAQ